jgi:hypothetical protein
MSDTHDDPRPADERFDHGPSGPEPGGEDGLVGTTVQLVADDPKSSGRVVREERQRVLVEGALVNGRYFAGWVPKHQLAGHGR